MAAGPLPVDALERELLAVDRVAVRSLVDGSLRAGATPHDVVEELLVPALDRIGASWEAGLTSLSQVYMAGRIVEELSSLPEACRTRILNHLKLHRARWTAHRVLWDLLDVALREGSALDREQVLDAAVALWWSEHRVVPPGGPEATRASREAWSLRRTLEACCENVTALMTAVSSLIERPRRSSSLVEALNSRLRVLQMVHRNVSDHLLALVALRWNLSTRIEGRRRGACPFVDLGIDFADGTTPWYDTLLKEIDAS